MAFKDLTPEEKETLDDLRQVFKLKNRPSLAARRQSVKADLMDWHFLTYEEKHKDYPPGEWLFYITPSLRPDQIEEMQTKLRNTVHAELKARKVDPEKHEFFPPLIGEGIYTQYPRVLIRREALQFLKNKGINVDLDPIFDEYYNLQLTYANGIRSCRDKLNELSGYPVWSGLEYANSGQKPYMRMDVPEGTEGAEYPTIYPFNSGKELRGFIKRGRFQSCMTYREDIGRDDTVARLTIQTKDLPALQKLVQRIESRREDFRSVITRMLLRAVPVSVVCCFLDESLVEAMTEAINASEAGSVTFGEMKESFGAKERIRETWPLQRLAQEFVTTEEMIDFLLDKPGKGAKGILEVLARRVPALADVIEEKRKICAVRRDPAAKPGFQKLVR